MFTAYIERVLRCTRNVLVKSEYIEYEYMTLKLYENKYKYEYLKNYSSTRVPSTSAPGLTFDTGFSERMYNDVCRLTATLLHTNRKLFLPCGQVWERVRQAFQ